MTMNRRDALRAFGAVAAGSVAAAVGASERLLPPVTMLPASLSADSFKKAVGELRQIVGDEWVFVDESSLVPYSKMYLPDPQARHLPSGAVAPASTEEVQAIVRIANKYRLPLWPISTGKNMGYGTATPASSGQMILDLKRMNRILDVDAELCTALVEPGVTYQDLANYLAEHDIPLRIDVPTIGPIAGPVGNTLDRGEGYTPYGDHFMMQCGMEVVLPDGRLLHTGMGSVKNGTRPGSAWQTFKWGYGPYIDGLFTQSNYGIVTKMGMWLMPAPPMYKPFMVRNRHVEDVRKIVDAMRPLRISNVIPNVVLMMSAQYQLAIFNRRSDFWNESEPVPDEVIAKAAADAGLGMWNTYFALYGTEVMIAENERIIRKAFEAIDGEVLTSAEMEGNRYFNHHATMMRGGLTIEELGIARWRGAGGGLAWFAPVAAAKGDEIVGQIALAKEILGKHGFDYTSAFAIGMRELHHVIALLYDRTDAEQHVRADHCYRELIQRFGERGWSVYRAGTTAMDLVAKQYGEVNRDFNQLLKRALDPNGIVAPGKSGIY